MGIPWWFNGSDSVLSPSRPRFHPWSSCKLRNVAKVKKKSMTLVKDVHNRRGQSCVEARGIWELSVTFHSILL